MVSDSFPAERLLDSFGRELLRTCFAYLEDEALAEDALQETFLRAWRAWDRFEGRCSEKTWLTGIVTSSKRSVFMCVSNGEYKNNGQGIRNEIL